MEIAKPTPITKTAFYSQSALSYCEIPQKYLTVSVKATAAGGGGTGQEYPKNLLIPGNGAGNKWYDPYSKDSTWIEIKISTLRQVAMIGLKSANDCPNRDPFHFILYGRTADQEEVMLHEVNGLKFEERYMWKLFSFSNSQAFGTYKIHILSNKSLAESGSWGDGTQLAEVSLYELVYGIDD